MSLWSSAEAVAATGGVTRGNWCATGVSIDSRTLQKGDLFVALKEMRDGHDFVAQALAQGAAAALVSRRPDKVAADAPLLLVRDVQTALEALARAARTRCSGRIVAVTGSVGKTSTKEMLRNVLLAHGRTHVSVASYNNHWGVPLSLARMPKDTQFGVFEIGMSRPGEIAPLAAMVRPHIAIITTVVAAHLEAFENVAAIAWEKASVFQGLEPGGWAVYNCDIPMASILRAVAGRFADRQESFGSSPPADYKLHEVSFDGKKTLASVIHIGGMRSFELAAIGAHFAQNALAVLATGDALGLPPQAVIDDLAAWRPFIGRGERSRIPIDPLNGMTVIDLIDESYNANPTSLAAALAVLAAVVPAPGGRRIAYLGDMKELGSTAVVMHAEFAVSEFVEGLDCIHAVGPLMRHLYEALPSGKRGRWTATSTEMSASLEADLRSGDVVLVKGSLSMAMGRLVDAIENMGHARAEDAGED